MNTTGKIIATMCLVMFASFGYAEEEQSGVDVWNAVLKDKYFKGVDIKEDETVIKLKTPYRAEDAAIVPISISATMPQKPDLYIKELYVFVDQNPMPLVAKFTLTPDMGKADLAMRIRIDKYTNVRAIAKLNTGEYHMVSHFVKAQGGCSAPAQGDLKAALARRGKMRFRTLSEDLKDGLALGQLMVSHPNLTGLQLDQRTRAFIPANYIKKIDVKYNGKTIMTAETGISVSADPSFRFFFKPQPGGGEITADVVTSEGEQFEKQFKVKI